jgi:hypothetical protein
MIDGPQLNWGYLSRWWREPHEGGSTPIDLGRIWQVAAESLDLVVDPIARFELAGTLNSHPGHLRSTEAKQPFPAIFALAVASRTATEPLASQSRATAAAALLPWTSVYVATGNPIDEWFFLPILQAIDLVASALTNDAKATLLAWVQTFVTSSDRFYGKLAPRNPARANNWMARRLVIRAMASTVSGDRAARASIAEMLSDFVGRNLVQDPRREYDGQTFDFVQRDALHYHVASFSHSWRSRCSHPTWYPRRFAEGSSAVSSSSVHTRVESANTSSSRTPPSPSIASVATPGIRCSRSHPGIPPVVVFCSVSPEQVFLRFEAGLTNWSTPRTTRAPSCWQRSSASRFARSGRILEWRHGITRAVGTSLGSGTILRQLVAPLERAKCLMSQWKSGARGIRTLDTSFPVYRISRKRT